MFLSEAINIPVLGIIENMAYFTPEELPNNKYYLFGKEGAKNLAEDLCSMTKGGKAGCSSVSMITQSMQKGV